MDDVCKFVFSTHINFVNLPNPAPAGRITNHISCYVASIKGDIEERPFFVNLPACFASGWLGGI